MKISDMKSLLIIISLLISLQIIAQKSVGSPEELKALMKTKTLVVITDSQLSEYNVEIKEAVKKSWKLTEYEFISEADYEKKRTDVNYSFLTLDDVMYEKDNSKSQYTFLCLSLGGKYATTSDAPQLCTVPLSYQGADEDTYAYKIGTIINFVQEHILLTLNDPSLNDNNIINHYNKNIESIKDKTLYIVRDELGSEVNSEAEIKKVYPYKFKLVEREEVEEAIDDNDDSVVFLHKVGPTGTKYFGRCFKVIIGAADAKMYYYDYHMVNEKNPDGMLEKDFKKLANQ